MNPTAHAHKHFIFRLSVANRQEPLRNDWPRQIAPPAHESKRTAKKVSTRSHKTMKIMHPHQITLAFYWLLFQGTSNVPGQGLLNSISQFITGPFGKAITLIAIVLCGVSPAVGRAFFVFEIFEGAPPPRAPPACGGRVA
jgi:hypothetical protein